VGVDNDSPSLATHVWIHPVDQVTGGVDWSTTIMALVAGDHVYGQAKGSASSWHRWKVTGPAVTNGSNKVIPVTSESGSPQGTEPANGADVVFAFQFQPLAGPAGATGPAGPPGASVIWRGTWAAATAYAVNDAVTYNGSSYIRTIAGTTATNPASDTTNWAVLSSKGDTGAQGPTGATGATGPAGADAQPRQLMDEGSALAVRGYVNFVGSGVTAADDAANDRINVTIPGGIAPTDMRRRMRPGRYYFQNVGGALSNVGWGQNNRLYCTPLDVEQGVVLDRLGISIGTVSSPTTATVRFGIYADTGDGYPGARIIDAGTVDVGTLGAREVTLSQLISDSLIWLAALVQGATTTLPNAAGWAGSALTAGSYGFQDSLVTGVAVNGQALSVNAQSAGLPSTFPDTTDSNVTAFGAVSTPRIWARVAP
jgi:hypothetical protein